MVRERYAIQFESGLYSVKICRVLIEGSDIRTNMKLASGHLKTVNEAVDVIFVISASVKVVTILGSMHGDDDHPATVRSINSSANGLSGDSPVYPLLLRMSSLEAPLSAVVLLCTCDSLALWLRRGMVITYRIPMEYCLLSMGREGNTYLTALH